MYKKQITLLLLAVSLSSYSQQCLVSEGEIFAHGIGKTGTVPEALRQMTQGRHWHLQENRSQHRIHSRAQRMGLVAEGERRVGPLLASIRAQEEPYNLLCPYWTYKDGTTSTTHCLSGCVATAIEQVMAYYRFPELLKDTLFGWETENYIIDDMLPGTRFDWKNYLNDYRDGWTEVQGMAIARVSLAAGMAVHMRYGLGSSGANVYRAVEPLHRAFGYGMAEYYDRIFYTPARWHAMLRHELEAGRPIVYAGHNMDLGGHAFNIDGVDANGFYHVNWGYNGSYDGWYDLDWLNPFEPTDMPENGYVIGFFCNQSALFMHPSEEVQPLTQDTLALDDLNVELESLKITRPADTNGRIAADFQFVNHGSDSITYTYEVMTWLPTDTAIFWQADYVGLSGMTLAPGERRTQRTYLQFSVPGERIIGISHDDVTIPFQQPVSIARGRSAKLEWSPLEWQLEDNGTSVRVSATVTNSAPDGYSGDLVTMCLYADGHEDEDTRHYEVLSLPGGSSTTVSKTFSHLQPATHYTLLLRCPWPIQQQADFTTPATDEVTDVRLSMKSDTYDVLGRPTTGQHRQFFIQQGKKYVGRNTH